MIPERSVRSAGGWWWSPELAPSRSTDCLAYLPGLHDPCKLAGLPRNPATPLPLADVADWTRTRDRCGRVDQETSDFCWSPGPVGINRTPLDTRSMLAPTTASGQATRSSEAPLRE